MRVGLLALGLAAVLSLTAVGPARADEKDAPGKPAAGKAGHDDKAAHKERDPFEQALDLTIWTVVVFGILLFLLTRFAWKPMLAGLQKREENIAAAIEDAKKARQETQQMREHLQAELQKGHEQIRDMLDEARRDAEHTKNEMIASARAEIQTERDRLRREISTARDQALQDVFNQAGQLATLISSKVIRRELTADDHHRLIDEALSELAQANVGWKDRTVY